MARKNTKELEVKDDQFVRCDSLVVGHSPSCVVFGVPKMISENPETQQLRFFYQCLGKKTRHFALKEKDYCSWQVLIKEGGGTVLCLQIQATLATYIFGDSLIHRSSSQKNTIRLKAHSFFFLGLSLCLILPADPMVVLIMDISNGITTNGPKWLCLNVMDQPKKTVDTRGGVRKWYQSILVSNMLDAFQ